VLNRSSRRGRAKSEGGERGFGGQIAYLGGGEGEATKKGKDQGSLSTIPPKGGRDPSSVDERLINLLQRRNLKRKLM